MRVGSVDMEIIRVRAKGGGNMIEIKIQIRGPRLRNILRW